MNFFKKRKKLIIILGVILLIIILSIALKPKSSPYEFSQVERKDLEQVVSASGTVKPSQEINLQFETSGKVKNIFVKVGDQVKAGQALIKLDDADLQVQYLQQQAVVEAAKAQLDLTKAGTSQEEITLAENTVANAIKNLNDVKEKANHDLSVLYDSSIEILNDAYLKNDSMYYRYLADIFTMSNSITFEGKLNFSTTKSQSEIQAENYYSIVGTNLTLMSAKINQFKISYLPAEVDQALDNFKKYSETSRLFLDAVADALNNSVGISSTNLTTYKTNLDTARTNINTVISNILTKQQAIASQKITNQTNQNTAQSTLDQANQQLVIKKAGARAEDLRYQEALIKQQTASLAGVAEKIRKTSLVAPIDGLVTSINVEVGEPVVITQASLTMNSVGNFEIELDIAETDITKVSLGQAGRITVDALVEEHFMGHVVKIDPAQTIIQGVVYYKTTISFDQQDDRIRSGMTVNVDIIIAERKNVLTIPLRSLTKNNGLETVKILENNQIKEIEVTTGLVGSSSEVEVINGLVEEQEIISFVKEK